MVRSDSKALITGASSGIGAIYADRLAARGHDLILVARSKDKLSALAASLAERYGRAVEPIGADLLTREGLLEVERILATDAGISMLVNNAGVGATKALIDSDVQAMDALIQLDVTALMRLTYAAVPNFLRQRRGTIVNMGSIVGIAPEILNGVYGGAKAFVLAFSQSLHHELRESGIRVQVVVPGATATAFWDAAGTPVEHLPAEIVMSAQDVVDAALAGLDSGELVTIPSLPDLQQWNAYELARQAIMPNLSRSEPAERYLSRGLADA
jgi:short-subunit dehydrogenase